LEVPPFDCVTDPHPMLTILDPNPIRAIERATSRDAGKKMEIESESSGSFAWREWNRKTTKQHGVRLLAT
jgi:hypothetical protein